MNKELKKLPSFHNYPVDSWQHQIQVLKDAYMQLEERVEELHGRTEWLKEKLNE